MIHDLALSGYTFAALPMPKQTVRRHLRIKHIQRSVAHYYDMPVAEMLSRRRRQDICRARQVAMYLTYKLLPHSYPQIGRAFDRDHTTVIHGVQHVQDLIRSNPEIAEDVESLMQRFGV